MQRKTTILKAIAKEISNWIEADGYIYQTSLDAFVCRGEELDKRIVINLNKWRNINDKWYINLYIQIRYHAIEEVLNRYRTYLSTSDAKKTSTISVLLSNLYPKNLDIEQLYIANQLDLEKTSCTIQTKVKKFAFPFFEKFSKLEYLQSNLESNKPIEWVSTDLTSRCEILLAIYLLKGDRKAFLSSADKFKEIILKKTNSYHLKIFEEKIQKILIDYRLFF
jgi:hypothetical protein